MARAAKPPGQDPREPTANLEDDPRRRRIQSCQGVTVREVSPMPRKATPATVRGVVRTVKMVPSPEEMKMIESTKLKLHE
jgi:hypothetical protein